jgi:hypothetical protein
LKEYKTTTETNIYTCDITDLYTMILQKEAVLAECEFLGRYAYRKVNGLSTKYNKSQGENSQLQIRNTSSNTLEVMEYSLKYSEKT